ncbi:hypothetical protein LI610_03990 [Lactobacillus delbrueckii subsp. indicus]|nr:hypothetical protein LI610_03990 [Lactobacillus delbrueckii subsp. indicus]
MGIFPFSFLSKTFIHGENLAKKIAKSLGPVRDEAVFDKSIFWLVNKSNSIVARLLTKKTF